MGNDSLARGKVRTFSTFPQSSYSNGGKKLFFLLFFWAPLAVLVHDGLSDCGLMCIDLSSGVAFCFMEFGRGN